MRYATIKGGVDRLAQLRAYMPGNYHAIETAEGFFVRGEDRMGWTLEDYVLPRLASGLIFGVEVMADPLPVGCMVRTERLEGVACWFRGHPIDDCPHAQVGEYCECDEAVDYDSARVVMVGDDHTHVVPTDSLIVIDEADFCPGCGQIGCTALGEVGS